jgi:hypothetical protein
MEGNRQQYLREMNQRYVNQLNMNQQKQMSNYNQLLTTVGEKPIRRRREKDQGLSQIGRIIENTTRGVERTLQKSEAKVDLMKDLNYTKEYDEDTRNRQSKALLTLDKHIAPKYSVKTLILDSNYRDVNIYPNVNNFVVTLADTIKDVAAIRFVRTELYQDNCTAGYFVLNGMRIPLQTNTAEPAYLNLNNYSKAYIGNNVNIPNIFGRILPGSEYYPAISGSFIEDPYTHVFKPVHLKMRRFHVRLLNYDGTSYSITNTGRVVLTFALYCLN